MSGFNTKALININDLLHGDNLINQFYNFAEKMVTAYEGADEYQDQLSDFIKNYGNSTCDENLDLNKIMDSSHNDDTLDEILKLANAMRSTEGMTALLHRDGYCYVKKALYYYLAQLISKRLAGDNGTILRGYFIPDTGSQYDSWEDDSLIFGFAEPGKVIKFVDEIPGTIAETINWLLTHGGLMGKTVTRELVNELCNDANSRCSGLLNAYYLKSGFELMYRELNEFSPAFGFDEGLSGTFPDERMEKRAHNNPENYIIVSLLLKETEGN